MAGIISNVDSDVQKLRKLKNAIEDVKKSLKGINIKVDIDIANGLQAQLKSLTEQYHALVSKIADAEGKILLSTKRINDASEKIIQAQETVSKVVSTPAQTGNVNTQANTAETVSIQAQAKAYDDLKTEINDILGTRDANVKRMVDEMNAIRLINMEIKKITKSQGESSSLSSAQQKRLEHLNNSLLTHKTALSEVRQTLSNNVKLDNVASTSMNGLSQSLSRMRIAYRELTEEERNSPLGKELLASINQADAKIKELDATIGNHQRNVGNYGKQWNGLSMSIQQVGRELPSLAYGPKVFFSAISNNLPILADEIKRARTEYELLKKSGQAATPVWKQVISSLFSWQTALTVGITLLTLYGDKLVDWASGLFNAKDAVKDLLSAEQEMALARKKAVSDSTKERTELDLLYKKLKDTSLSTKERTAAVNEWMKKYPQHSNIMNGELVSLGKLELAYQSLSKQIIESAKARSYSDRITELESKRFDANFKRLNQKNTLGIAESEYLRTKEIYEKLQKDYNSGKSVGQALSAARVPYMNAKEEYEKQKEIYANLEKETNDYASKINYIAEQIKVDDLYPQPKKGSYDYWQQQVQIADAALKQIDSKQKALLDNAVKDPKKDLYGLGIDKSIVDSYKQAIKLKSEAEKELKAYDSSSKQESASEKEADKQLKQQEKLAEDLLSLRRKNQQDEINLMADGTDKKLAQIDLDYRKELDAIRKQEQEWSKTNGGKLTEEQSVQISLSYSQAESKRGKSISDVNKEELEAMNRYLKEYGTFQQKKEAITKEYNEKIAKATTEGDKKILQKEMEEALSSVDMDKLKQEINWELIFSDLSKVSKKSLEQVKQQLKTFKNSDEYKNMAVDQKKVIDEALNNIQSTIIDKGGLLGDLPEQLDALRIAQEELKQAQDEYNKALKTGTDAEKEAALKKKNNAEKNVQNAETNVTKSADKTKQNLITLADTITQLGSSSEMSLSQTGNLASGLVDVFSEAGSKLGGIIGAAFSLLDGIEKQGLDGFVENVFSSVFRAGASMWDTITFGAFSKITGSGESDKNLEKDLEYLAQSNQDLKNSLDNLSEKMDKASVADASDIYAVQKKNIETLEANTREAMQRSAAAYNNGFLGIGGSHSSGSKIDKGMSTSEWKRVSDIVGRSVSSAGQFFRLSSEQMAKLAEEDTSLYSKIKDLANNGYKDAAQYMDEYITYYKQLEELENAYNEKLTNTSFDSIRSDFKNALLDMESDAEDFADNFEKMMQNAIVESLMTKKYDKLLQEWYSDFAKAMEGDGKISENEQISLKRQWENITKQAIAERDALKEVMGWESESESTSQSSTSKGFGTEMTHEDAGELSGRFTALQITGEEIKNQSITQSQSLNLLTVKIDTILSINTEAKNIADDTRDLIAQSYLELVEISENTGNSAKYLKDIKADIAEVKKNTSKL